MRGAYLPVFEPSVNEYMSEELFVSFMSLELSLNETLRGIGLSRIKIKKKVQSWLTNPNNEMNWYTPFFVL